MATTNEMIENWTRRSRVNQMSHYESAKMYSIVYYCLGIPLVVVTASLGAINSANKHLISTEMTSLLLFTISILAALQTFLKLSERAQKHKTAASKYGAIRRDLETLMVKPKVTDAEIKTMKNKMDGLALEAPSIPYVIWKKTDRQLLGVH